MTRTRRLCVVGAGVAGAGAADALRETDVDVTVLEKSRGVGGRAATRRGHGCRYDHGANYVRGRDGRTTAFLRELGEEGLVTVDGPVWTFDASGSISPGDDRPGEKWTWTAGITQLGKRLLARADATVERETRVEALDFDAGDETWTVTDADGDAHGPYDALLLTPPAPQTAALLAETAWSDERLLALREAVGAVPYRTVRSVVLHYPFELDYPWYALVDADGEHAIGWLSREECKPGHVPDGESLLVVQMSPEWSARRHDRPPSDVEADVADRVAALLDDPALSDPDWTDDQRWRYALPDAGVDAGTARTAEDVGLYVAGDWVAGEGRVHEALWNGVAVGERIAGDR